MHRQLKRSGNDRVVRWIAARPIGLRRGCASKGVCGPQADLSRVMGFEPRSILEQDNVAALEAAAKT
ncbi:hypothetical protein [Methylobacterium nodulans]|uniref:Uncharacterized protein n=1 Tax=Methylobacterium nodulans (strain LMG 21967 / CNCM I-2342 / ORS 2060) TaxID=460265 RepID=B8IPC3_METNO|nr:hypothetical protein [Methylobacterium nodulans]ACL62215.1 hypothetical protein Mnod_7478 [Methylobacterium nodulans ORS 2060]